MSLAIVNSRASIGINAILIAVEAHISNGLPKITLVGLAETEVKESKERVRSAIINSHFDFPVRRITISLAPADLPKQGGRFDLPIALAILAASKQIAIESLQDYEFIGELGLSGELRAITAALPFAIAAKKANHKICLPFENAVEASLSHHNEIYPVKNMLQICSHLQRKERLQPFKYEKKHRIEASCKIDIAEVKGQVHAKRALEIAAAGRHNLLFIGPPGAGKTMLATRLPSLLPLLSEDEALEVASIYSVLKKEFKWENWRLAPFRAPHHTSSSISLVGGSSPPRPGEISLAHRGVLFLDELVEFKREALEALREPLESQEIAISRATHKVTFPANFQLIAAMNPCPCGLGSLSLGCQCTPERIQRYYNKLSSPFLDRIDMHIKVFLPTKANLLNQSQEETSLKIRARVKKAREKQLKQRGKLNYQLSHKEVEKNCQLEKKDQCLMNEAIENFQLSARTFHRILKVARTIADLENCEAINSQHLLEALSYRTHLQNIAANV